MRQTFKAKDEGTLWELESELRGLGFKWSSGTDSHVKKILEHNEPFPAYIHVYTGDRTLTWSSEYGMGRLKYPVDATFETGQRLFIDSDGSVHIYEVSKPLDEQPKEPEFRYVQVDFNEVVQELTRGTYYYEADGYDGLIKVYVDTRFKMGELAEMRFFRLEEF